MSTSKVKPYDIEAAGTDWQILKQVSWEVVFADESGWGGWYILSSRPQLSGVNWVNSWYSAVSSIFTTWWLIMVWTSRAVDIWPWAWLRVEISDDGVTWRATYIDVPQWDNSGNAYTSFPIPVWKFIRLYARWDNWWWWPARIDTIYMRDQA